MSLTGRIKLYLIIVALVPPLLIMSVIYFQTIKSAEAASRHEVINNLSKYAGFRQTLEEELTGGIERLVYSASFKRNMAEFHSGKSATISFDPKSFGLSFAELLSPELIVLASYHRPGLVGEIIQPGLSTLNPEIDAIFESAEYDVAGGHVSLTKLKKLDNDNYLYTGIYLDQARRTALSHLMEAKVLAQFDTDSLSAYEGMEQGGIYDDNTSYRVLLMGSAKKGFAIAAVFIKSGDDSAFFALLGMTGLVAFFSVAVSIGMGIYITSRAEREIDNLVRATSRVAAGDFDAPVMAYEEGPFSQLADSFTDMTIKLKVLQKQLSTTERIAAWQIVGRKIAHEIKNPLTPIAISADDLRKSYKEKLPDFDRTLEETTATIKKEVKRMNQLLDQFVSFARMKAPDVRQTDIGTLVENISSLYRHEINNGRLVFAEGATSGRATFDPESMQQVLINLIKNGLEAGKDSVVTVAVGTDKDLLTLRIEDNGPGFTDEKLQNSFDPYVSTKDGGSGLGLVVCHRIVHDHGGTLELYNHSQGGAGVLIRIPA